jgi:hypothetical protein
VATQWLKMIRQAQNENLGEAIVRLAGLAAAAERYEQGRAASSSAPTDNEGSTRTTTGRVVMAARTEVSR